MLFRTIIDLKMSISLIPQENRGKSVNAESCLCVNPAAA